MENENGPGAETTSSPVVVGKPVAPRIDSVTGGKDGLMVAFTPLTPITGDAYKFLVKAGSPLAEVHALTAVPAIITRLEGERSAEGAVRRCGCGHKFSRSGRIPV